MLDRESNFTGRAFRPWDGHYTAYLLLSRTACTYRGPQLQAGASGVLFEMPLCRPEVLNQTIVALDVGADRKRRLEIGRRRRGCFHPMMLMAQ